MVENRPLARSLYDEVDIGDRIPEQFFKAIAEILAYVYRIQRKINLADSILAHRLRTLIGRGTS